MSVFKRAGSPFYHYRFMYNGRRHTGSTGETGPYKAAQVEALKKAALMRGEQLTGSRKTPTLEAFSSVFLEYFRAVVETGQRSANTLTYYESGFRMLAQSPIWWMKLHQIRGDDADTFRASGVDGQVLQPATINCALCTLRRTLSFAQKRKLIVQAPDIELHEVAGRERIIESWMEELMLRYASSWMRLALIFGLDHGMRAGEVLRLKWEAINWTDGKLLIERGKSRNARRMLDLTDRAMEELRLHRDNGSQWIFPSGRERTISKRADALELFSRGNSTLAVAKILHIGQATARAYRDGRNLKSSSKVDGSISVSALDRAFRLLIDGINLERRKQRRPLIPTDLVFHSTRHTCLTVLAAKKVDVAQIARVAGHSDIRTTMRYIHAAESAEAAEVMNEHNEQKASIALVAKRS